MHSSNTHGVEKLTESEIREELARIQERRAKQLAYNKVWRDTHELTPEAKAKRYAYSKAYAAKKRLYEQELLKKAEDLGLLS